MVVVVMVVAYGYGRLKEMAEVNIEKGNFHGEWKTDTFLA
jgi:hypothetical protein